MDQITKQPKTHVERRGTTETRDGMVIDWDVPIPMEDGLVLRADVYRPDRREGRYPVILSYGPYAKWLLFKDGYSTAWDIMVQRTPGRPGRLHQRLPELGGGRPGEVGAGRLCDRARRFTRRGPLARLSSTHSRRARRSTSITASSGRPCSRGAPARSAWPASPITPSTSGRWPACSRRTSRRSASGKAPATATATRTTTAASSAAFQTNWYDMQVKTVQHGLRRRGDRQQHQRRSRLRPRHAPERRSSETIPLRLRRGDRRASAGRRLPPRRSADWDKITVPLLSCGNWGGKALHLRGNIEGFVRAASKQKWLEVHGDSPLDAVLHRLRHQPAEAVSSGTSSRARTPAGTHEPRGPTPGPSSGREIRRAARERMAARAHPMDEILSRSCTQRADARSASAARRPQATTRWATA